MKAIKITYWISTVIVALMMAYSAFAYLTKPEMQQAFQHLGYPDHLRIELAIAKILGAIILLAPFTGSIKEWAYAGFTFTFIAAFIAHNASGDPMNYRAMPVIFLVILAVSYITWRKKTAGQLKEK